MNYNTILFIDGSKTSLLLYNEIRKKNKFQILLIVLSPNCSSKIRRKIKSSRNYKVLVSDLKHKNSILNHLFRYHNIDLIFSFYNFKIPEYILKKLSIGGINFHPSYLPYNKGKHSTFWAVYNKTPLGATAHWMTKKYDEGDIFFQKKINHNLYLTAKDIYPAQIKLLEKIIKIVIQKISQGVFIRKKQIKKKNEYHFAKDILNVVKFNFDSEVSTSLLLSIIRGTHFKNYGFYIVKNNNTYKICSRLRIIKKNKINKNFIARNKIIKNKFNIKKIFDGIEKLKEKSYLIIYKNYIFKIKSRIIKYEV